MCFERVIVGWIEGEAVFVEKEVVEHKRLSGKSELKQSRLTMSGPM